MNYEFSLNKMAALSLLIGSILMSVLLFGAGLIVGAQWLGEAAAPDRTVARNEEPDVPAEPVLHELKAPSVKPPAAPAIPAPAAPVGPTTGPPVAAPAPAATTQAVLTPVAAAATNGEVQIISEAAADEPSESAASEPEYVTVQIGVFLDEKAADRLLKEVERKGYAPSFFSGRDAQARQWYAVRIGAYSDKQQAANAAANFTRQEKMKATVRPLESL